MTGIIILNEKQLRELAELIWRKENVALRGIDFQSAADYKKYHRDSKAAYDNVVRLLDDGSALVRKYENDESAADRASIAHTIFDLTKKSLNMAVQTMPHYHLRLNYVKKISEHTSDLIQVLDGLDSTSATFLTEAKALAETAQTYRNIMLEYSNKYRSFASNTFSKVIKEKNMTFEQLVQKYKRKLNFEGRFEGLKDAEKLLVYDEIIAASGRGRVIVEKLYMGTGIALILLTAGMMVWDIYSSDHKIETATRDAVSIAAGVTGTMLGALVEVALGTLLGVESCGLFVVAMGFLVGLGAGYLIGEYADKLLDSIFQSGGSAQAQLSPPSLKAAGYQCYLVPLPDGVALAHQIASRESAN